MYILGNTEGLFGRPEEVRSKPKARFQKHQLSVHLTEQLQRCLSLS